MCFYYIFHKNSIGHLLRTSQDSFRSPPPQSFRKEMDNILFICIMFYFYVHFQVVFVVFVVLYLKFGLKILIFTITAIILERGLLLLTMYSSFENTTYKDH